MQTRADALAVMAKAPVPGLVKTRLVPPLTADQAAALARALLEDQLEHVSNMRRAEVYLAFTPDEAAAFMADLLPAGCRIFAQTGADLGERMQNCLAELWGRGHRNAMLIGGDLPPIPLEYFDQAFEFLSGAADRAVLGPSRDGGFYLIGMNRAVPRLFCGMTWSHARVLAETTERLSRHSIEFSLLPEWFDVDCAGDLASLRRLSKDAVLVAMKRTRIFLSQLSGA